MDKKQEIIRLLKKEYKGAKIALHYGSTFELLVAVILSAQCTDRQVNVVTEELFKKYKTPDDYAGADFDEFSRDIRSTGFFRNKARNVIRTARRIVDDFAGDVPQTMEELLTLFGVARKTANIVLYNAFGKNEGIAVDTHVRRVSGRLGLSHQKSPEKIERDLMKILKRNEWGRFSYVLIEHGRAVCRARNPLCRECAAGHLCPSRKGFFP